MMVCVTVLCTVTSVIVWFSIAGQQLSVTGFQFRNGLDCNRKLYKFQVTNTDSTGRSCSDEIEVMSCWGRCDSNEVSDWRFPYKRSHHPVCIHGGRQLSKYVLKDCDEGVEPGTEEYVFPEATSCKCHACKSSEASCEGYGYTNFQFVPSNEIDEN
ncbi:Gonadotropin, beta subunit,GPCR, family 2, extracellular hormone receptor domain,Glycoprotein hormone [Cinara cedri]|uniref:Gonadotropin, beta subunit,GPCR, family 2, extracellular hormone receptor domain,Glycoprotein hormone n=1 Tax=Cinara cedri TaxID=506608 RepID=A0A5E4NK36_9HEMI|nr:Gonadotropin, beta subunit,GPCR, family 2, extracellular hormone receptor domain,Glycoprotein hormone [Cinara cedri]